MARVENELLNYQSKYEKDGVLINKLGITSPEELEKMEREITTFKLSKLYLNPGKQSFDINHYLAIHKYLFEDIYPFAGEIRNENIAKRTPFCLPQFIYPNLKYVLDEARHVMPTLTDIDKLVSYLAKLYSDLNIIHPFREGNGRAGREFIRQYIETTCKMNNLGEYEINFGEYDKTDFINAVIKADISCDYSELEKMFRNMIKTRTK